MKAKAKRSSQSGFQPAAGYEFKGDPKMLLRAREMLQGMREPTKKAIEAAHETIAKIIVNHEGQGVDAREMALFLISCRLSRRSLHGYATVDWNHIQQLKEFALKIEAYIDDAVQKRPLNFLMLASPGSGKSHLINCIAALLEDKEISPITFNMVGLQTNEDLIPPLDAARNLKVEDTLPLLFLDEFDSKENNIPLLLPLLWDGEMNVGRRDLKLGKLVVVLAGSDPRLPSTMEEARNMRREVHGNDGSRKMTDLLSRINGGVITIPPFWDAEKGIDRRVDKVCVAVHLLRSRFGRELRTVPLGLLRFIAEAEFRYGVRSIAHLIDLIPRRKNMVNLKLSVLGLPIADSDKLKSSSLAYHLLNEEQAHGIAKLWKRVKKPNIAMAIRLERVEFPSFTMVKDAPDTYLSRVLQDLDRIGVRDESAIEGGMVA